MVDRLFRIGELAKQAGVNKSVVDHYTRLGLIEPAARSDGKYRLYSQEALNRIGFIHKCQDRRLSLEEIGYIIKNKAPVGNAEIYLCMTQAVISIDAVINELKSVGKKVEQSAQIETELLRNQTDDLAVKISAATELLQSILGGLI